MSLTLQPISQRRVAPGLARQLPDALLRVVDVALDPAGRDRRRREAAVAEPLRVPRVLPGLVRQPARRPPLVLDEAVAIAVAVLVDPRKRGERRHPERLDQRTVPRP